MVTLVIPIRFFVNFCKRLPLSEACTDLCKRFAIESRATNARSSVIKMKSKSGTGECEEVNQLVKERIDFEAALLESKSSGAK